MKKQVEAEGGQFLMMGGISDSVEQAAVLPALHFDNLTISQWMKKPSTHICLVIRKSVARAILRQEQ